MGTYNTYTDQELMALIKQGEHRAFDFVHQRYSKELLNAAFKRLDSVEEAEEIVQELFVNLYIRRSEIEITQNLGSFLRTALKYKVFNVYRSRFTRERYATLIQQQSSVEYADPSQHMEAKELALKIQKSTQKLPAKCREVFILSKVEHLSNKTIAERLGISISAVEQHITKAFKLIKADFENYDQGLILILLLLYYK